MEFPCKNLLSPDATQHWSYAASQVTNNQQSQRKFILNCKILYIMYNKQNVTLEINGKWKFCFFIHKVPMQLCIHLQLTWC